MSGCASTCGRVIKQRGSHIPTFGFVPELPARGSRVVVKQDRVVLSNTSRIGLKAESADVFFGMQACLRELEPSVHSMASHNTV